MHFTADDLPADTGLEDNPDAPSVVSDSDSEILCSWAQLKSSRERFERKQQTKAASALVLMRSGDAEPQPSSGSDSEGSVTIIDKQQITSSRKRARPLFQAKQTHMLE